MSLIKTIFTGIKYMNVWPEAELLGPVFPENRAKYVMRIGRYVLPPFIILILRWSFIRGGGLHEGISFMFAIQQNWHVTVLCVLFLLSMPLQGYYWFGKRAVMKLNPKLKLFYTETCTALLRQPLGEPTMLDLAYVLRDGINSLGYDFLRKL